MSYETTWEKRGVYQRFYDNTTDIEVYESAIELQSSMHFDDMRFLIIDFRDVTGIKIINPSFIEEKAAIDSAAAITNPNIRIAVLATDPLIIELAKEYASHQYTPYQTQIYSNIEEAKKWVETPQALKLHN